jgi:hypothetical protein
VLLLLTPPSSKGRSSNNLAFLLHQLITLPCYLSKKRAPSKKPAPGKSTIFELYSNILLMREGAKFFIRIDSTKIKKFVKIANNTDSGNSMVCHKVYPLIQSVSPCHQPVALEQYPPPWGRNCRYSAMLFDMI